MINKTRKSLFDVALRFRLLIPIFLLVLASSLQCSTTKVKQYQGPAQILAQAEKKIEDGDHMDALFLLEQIVYNFPGYEKREYATFLIVKAYFEADDYVMAVAEGRDFVRDYPASEWADDAQFYVAEALYEQAPSFALDQAVTREAVVEYNTLLQVYPDTPQKEKAQKHLKQCINKLAKKEYKNGAFYKKMGMYDASLVYFETVLNNFADSDWIDDTLFSMGEIYMKQEKLGQASDSYNRLIENHPKSKWISEAEAKLSEINKWDGK